MKNVLVGSYNAQSRMIAVRLLTEIEQNPGYCKIIGIENTSHYRETANNTENRGDDTYVKFVDDYYSTDSVF